MDNILETLLGKNSLASLSEASGADKDQVRQVLNDALPALLESMQNNASTKDGEESLSKALTTHAEDDTSDIASFLKNVDLEDGAKILGHILGSNKKKLETGVAKKSGISADNVATILAAAAPLLLSLLGNKKKKNDDNGIGDLLGVLVSAFLGSGSQSGSKKNGGALGSILGALLDNDD